MSEHTPGPWKARRDLSLHRLVYHELPDGRWQVICDWGGWSEQAMRHGVDLDACSQEAYPNQEADARLIAAAPDLLAACQRFVDYDDIGADEYDAKYGKAEDQISAIRQQARDAIAKAKGMK